jgi:hypothetical protein
MESSRSPEADSTTSSATLSSTVGAARSTGFLLQLEEGLECLDCQETCQYRARPCLVWNREKCESSMVWTILSKFFQTASVDSLFIRPSNCFSFRLNCSASTRASSSCFRESKSFLSNCARCGSACFLLLHHFCLRQ